MTNDVVPHDPAGGSGVWERVIEVVGDLNLPKVIAGPAGEAISRLIAGGAVIPAAWLQQKAQAIRDKTEGQSLVAKTLAGAAAELVKNDPALVQRAADAFIAKEIRHQHNRETIAVKAIEQLKETPDANTTKPDDDWLNVFARHAQEASSERMQIDKRNRLVCMVQPKARNVLDRWLVLAADPAGVSIAVELIDRRQSCCIKICGTRPQAAASGPIT